MKLFANKKHTVVLDKEVPEKQDTPNPKKPKHSVSFKQLFVTSLKVLAIIIPLGLFLGGVPFLIFGGAAVIQPFFKAANFTITGSATAFSSFQKQAKLAQDANGLTNVLIVGIDTRASGSGLLLNTDTIIFASYNNLTNEMSMVSFPRDLAVTYPNTSSYGKINATYAYGEYRQAGGGMEYLRQLIEQITGKKIQYHVLVDLKGFTTIIDLLGGVDIDVAPGFSGYHPTDGYGWMKVTYNRGINHMDGNRALYYARIRYVYDADTYADYVAEASDFGRARRQQKVIQAVIDKAVNAENLKNTKAIFEILGTVANNIKINQITPSDVEAGLIILKDKGKPVTYSMVLDPASGGGSLITRDPYSTLYEIRPVAGRNNWSGVQAYLTGFLNEPLLVTTSQTIVVYDSGKETFSTQYSKLTSTISRAKYSNKGKLENLPQPGVYNIGGVQYKGTALRVADIMKLPYIDADKATFTPQQAEGNIVVVL